MATIVELLLSQGFVTKSLRDLLGEILGSGVNLDGIVDRIKDNFDENVLRKALETSGNQLCETLHDVGAQGLQSSSGLTIEQSIELMTKMGDSVVAQLGQAADTLRQNLQDQAAVLRALSANDTAALPDLRKKRNESQVAVRQDFIDAGRVALGDRPRTE